jgi:hypothetical protein
MLKKLKPFILGAIIIYLITLFYHNPILFKKKILRQSDIEQGIGINQESKELKEKTGEIALWYGRVFSGMPAFILGYPFIDDIKNKINYYIFSLGLPEPAGVHFIMLFSFFVFGYLITNNFLLGLLLSIIFSFNTFTILSLEAGHNAKIRAIAYLPYILGGIYLVHLKKWMIGLSLTALGVAFHINCGHYQISYYFFLALGIALLIWLAIELFYSKNFSHSLKVIGLIVLSILLGIGANFGKLWTSLEYQKQSIRGKYELTINKDDDRTLPEGLDKDYAFNWSQGILETLTLLIPGVYGGSSHEELWKNSATAKLLKSQNIPLQPIPLYFGNQPFTGGPIYGGVTICFFFVFSFFVLERKKLIISSIVFIFFLIISWGKNAAFINYFLFDYFPLFNKFRAVSMAIFIPLFIMGIVSLITLKRISEIDNKSILTKPLIFTLSILGSISIFLALFPELIVSKGIADNQLPDWLLEAINQDRKTLVSSDAWRTFLLLALVACTTWLLITNKLSLFWASSTLASLSFIDLLLVDSRYLNKNDYVNKKKYDAYIQPTEADLYILNDKERGFRVYNLQNPFNDGRTSYFHRSVGGYHPAKLRRYQDIIEYHFNKNNLNVVNMLNVKYIIKGNTAKDVILNSERCGNAWFVDSLIVVQNPDQEIEALNSFNPRTTAIVDISKFNITRTKFEKDTSDKINLTYYSPNYMVYESENGANHLAVFSEIFYQPGWTVTINQKPARLIRVNYILRALEVPEGKNKIEFKFYPKSYQIGKQISIVFNIVIFALFIISVLIYFKRN